MRTYEELKQVLLEVRENGFVVPAGVDVDGLIKDMLGYIGHVDAELRDRLIYSAFNTWVDSGLLGAARMRWVLAACLDEGHIFYGIGEAGTDSVFVRSFSMLVVSLAFHVQEATPFMTAQEVAAVREALLRYVALEKDFRGYVNGKGWAHAAAHVADALANLISCKVDGAFFCGREEVLEILQAVQKLVCNPDSVYTAEEDERLLQVVTRAGLFLPEKEVMRWLDGFQFRINNPWWEGNIPGAFNQHVNVKHFMRSLYFHFLGEGNDALCQQVQNYLR